uniref:Uncharacterized protein n=1 Tax=Schistocephalus solidus TaxID=70667 RepID=A0A0X3P424_SCHSO
MRTDHRVTGCFLPPKHKYFASETSRIYTLFSNTPPPSQPKKAHRAHTHIVFILQGKLPFQRSYRHRLRATSHHTTTHPIKIIATQIPAHNASQVQILLPHARLGLPESPPPLPTMLDLTSEQ